MISLENDHIKVIFAEKGAELQHLKNKITNKEYLWSGNPDYWGKYSPVLFPIVGGLKNNTYIFEGNEYHLPRHGFARDQQFEVSQVSDTEAKFTITHSDQTLKVYPFEFRLSLHYKITGNQLHCTYNVLNPSNKNLLFSVGGHPAFAVTTNNQLAYDDYFLEFNKDTELIFHKLSGDLITDETDSIKLQNHILPLTHRLFYEDALVIKTLKSDCISLRNHKNQHGLHFEFSGFPFFGIWAARNADFVCLEPWCGIADGINHDQNLTTKEGITSLAAHQNWERSWSVTCF